MDTYPVCHNIKNHNITIIKNKEMRMELAVGVFFLMLDFKSFGEDSKLNRCMSIECPFV